MGMRDALPSTKTALHDIQVIVVSPEEASFGVAEFWSADGLIGITCLDEGDLILRIAPSAVDVVVGAQALAKALAEAYRLLALY
jgi:hypothetical protein